jgi:hypothetical protein
MTAIRLIKSIALILLYIVLLPVWILLILLKMAIYKTVLTKNMVKSGIPKEHARQMAKEMSLTNLVTRNN